MPGSSPMVIFYWSSQHLPQVHELVLCKFQKTEPNTTGPALKLWDESSEFQRTCDPDSFAVDPSHTTVSVSFLSPDTTDIFEAFTVSLLSSLPIPGLSSPSYKALTEPGRGAVFSPDVGYNGHTREAYFRVGLQGNAQKDIQIFRNPADRTIDKVAKNRLEDDRIEALLHKIEIQMKHRSASFGFTLASKVASC
ncbi:Presequence protease, mitochondrial [Tupaia chinensis]|uniref:Presequence protease, mitochondrial n=1 Tax=Tupaia chinensis TaxID=246437 RepID=L9KHY3_TUPCH|nr:Presequence protease, mitochondrial [Tupaia chinensis]